VDPGRFQKVAARGVLGVRSISPESSDWVLFAPSSGNMPVVQEVGPVRFQARMAALFGECGGRPEAFLASGATRLEESGRRLLSASRSVSAAVSYGSGRPSLFITAGLPAEVRIHWPWAAEDLAWATESEGASWEWDPSREELCLSLPVGEHGLVADPRQRSRRNGS
jgi:hypothetical protein